MDSVLQALGWMGRYQRIQCFFLLLPILDCALHLVSFIFIGRRFLHECAKVDFPYPSLSEIKENIINRTSDATNSSLSVTYSACSVSVSNQSEEIYKSACVNGYDYRQPRQRSFVAEWDLVCDKATLPEVSQTILLAGMMVGAFLFAALSDKFGRKPVYAACHVMFLCVAVALAFAPSFAGFLCLRFLLGALHQGIGVTSCILMMELIPTERRAWAIQSCCFVWSLSLLIMCLVCYLCRDLTWRYTQLVLAAFSVYSLFQYWFVEESLRWLADNNRHDAAEQLIKRAAKANGVDAESVIQLYLEAARAQLDLEPLQPVSVETVSSGLATTESSEEQNLMPTEKPLESDEKADSRGEKVAPVCERPASSTSLAFAAFFKNKQILLMIVICFYTWFSDNLAYSGILLLSKSLANDLYLGFTLNVLVEFPSVLVLVILINECKMGRRQLTIASHLLGGLCLLIAVLLAKLPAAAGIPGVNTLTLIISLLGKFGLSLGFSVLWMYTPELFPTTIRSTALGVASVAARIGGMVSPYSITVARSVPWLPGAVFALLCLTVPPLVRLLPETGELELPRTVPDVQLSIRVNASSHSAHEQEAKGRKKDKAAKEIC